MDALAQNEKGTSQSQTDPAALQVASAPSAAQLKGHDRSWRDNFRDLCSVYRTRTNFYLWEEADSAKWKGYSLWGTFVRDYQEGVYEEYNYVGWTKWDEWKYGEYEDDPRG